ncbi:MAG TPA: hypothetical protein DEQ47_02485 [Solibacterales bacterium]|nr:hypothetical protein [Bryobacterales bacterium]
MLTLSAGEKQKAAQYLESTRDELLRAVRDLSEAQWFFKGAPERWSIAQILEHVVIVENGVHALIGRMPHAPETDRIDTAIDDFIPVNVPQRSTKVEAPGTAVPRGQWSPADTVERFAAARTRTLELLESAPALRGHVVPHPVLGPWDGYQWILGAAAHGVRHTEQIREVKAEAGFPG